MVLPLVLLLQFVSRLLHMLRSNTVSTNAILLGISCSEYVVIKIVASNSLNSLAGNNYFPPDKRSEVTTQYFRFFEQVAYTFTYYCGTGV
jgi:hypothetical protein